ncbi:hypothetical protein MKK67_30610 [Methylobacterium sp. J-072]|uniref:hypothetical protein n=1 Tax=Methylobacterium sp. J-072 TaxID=2836651 RepID=UPI001FBA2208|nr:hypothetical protein [Methylobacterium sp. J-072]MCJ2096828.1 hypothetical protein [Methylobacterium sp. J-072]
MYITNLLVLLSVPAAALILGFGAIHMAKRASGRRLRCTLSAAGVENPFERWLTEDLVAGAAVHRTLKARGGLEVPVRKCP